MPGYHFQRKLKIGRKRTLRLPGWCADLAFLRRLQARRVCIMSRFFIRRGLRSRMPCGGCSPRALNWTARPTTA